MAAAQHASGARPSVMRFTAADLGLLGSDFNATEVIPGMWVGALSAAENKERLAEHGIRHVVTVAARLHPDVPGDVVHTSVALDDHPCADLLSALPVVLAAIDVGLTSASLSTEGVLVHCASGVSRSVSACVAWLMTRKQHSLEESLRIVRAARPSANPNFGFMRALELLEASHCDIAAATEQWKGTDTEQLRENIRLLREKANALHAHADGLEEALAKRRSECGDSALPADLRDGLERLQLDIDSSVPHDMDDSVAKTIRKAVAQKVARLLGDE
mmetsp:Transcript_64566/g.185692  ORF Transcript_64566/g.185692 Transcript_64566/m.185692 type:complete len:275 (-) Transcript_64566:148-972(-)